MIQASNLVAQPHFDGHRYFNPFPTFKNRNAWDVAKWLLWDHIRAKRQKGHTNSFQWEEGQHDPSWLSRNRKQFSVTWIGHSTLLIQMQGLNILTDPIFSKRASPFSFIGPRRLVPPGLAFDDLPPIDLVIISHDHYDHLDKRTIKRLGNKPFYVVPLGVGAILRSWGIYHFREMDWRDKIEFNGLEIICTPAQHFSGRSPFRQNSTLWASWLLKSRTLSFYFGGDTGYFPGFKGIAQVYGPIDFAALPIGAYAPRWFMKAVHLDPEDALKAFKDLQAAILIPIHWGTFDLADEAPTQPLEVLKQKARMQGLSDRIWFFKYGETKIQRY